MKSESRSVQKPATVPNGAAAPMILTQIARLAIWASVYVNGLAVRRALPGIDCLVPAQILESGWDAAASVVLNVAQTAGVLPTSPAVEHQRDSSARGSRPTWIRPNRCRPRVS